MTDDRIDRRAWIIGLSVTAGLLLAAAAIAGLIAWGVAAVLGAYLAWRGIPPGWREEW